MDGYDLLRLRHELGLYQKEAFAAVGITSPNIMVAIERNRPPRMAPEEYERIAQAFRDYAQKKKQGEEVIA
jgi:hypothetical protein